MIELAVAMPLMLIVMAGLTIMLTTITHWSGQTQEETTLQTEARAAMVTFESGIRGAFPCSQTTNAITTATATSITYCAPDESATSVVGVSGSQYDQSFHLQTISYNVTGGMLQRQYATSTVTFPTGPPWLPWGATSAWMTVVGQANSIINTNTSLATDVFTYYTQAGAETTPPTPLTLPIADTSEIRAVGINLLLSTSGSQPEKFSVTDLVAVRETDS